jgi:hypothetical protein
LIVSLYKIGLKMVDKLTKVLLAYHVSLHPHMPGPF